jgi:hypothetical protein
MQESFASHLAAPPSWLRYVGGHLLCFSFNVWEEVDLVGNTASLGELSLSAFTGTTAGAIGGHLTYEPW